MIRPAVLLSPLLLLAACGSSNQHHSARLLDNRLQVQLASDIAAGRATVQPLPDGARVTLLDSTLFVNDTKALDDQYPDIRAGVIEALLDPSLMQVQVADTSALPADQRDLRERNVNQYFAANGLAGVLAAPEARPVTAGPVPAGLAITISVRCPPPNWKTGYGSGRRKPACD